MATRRPLQGIGIQHAIANGQMGQLHIAIDVELAEQPIAVAVDRLRAQVELFGNIGHLLPLGDHHHDLQLALGEGLEGVLVGRGKLAQGHLLGDLRGDVTLTGVDQANGVDHLVRRGPFGEIAGGTRLHHFGRERIF